MWRQIKKEVKAIINEVYKSTDGSLRPVWQTFLDIRLNDDFRNPSHLITDSCVPTYTWDLDDFDPLHPWWNLRPRPHRYPTRTLDPDTLDRLSVSGSQSYQPRNHEDVWTFKPDVQDRTSDPDICSRTTSSSGFQTQLTSDRDWTPESPVEPSINLDLRPWCPDSEQW